MPPRPEIQIGIGAARSFPLDRLFQCQTNESDSQSSLITDIWEKRFLSLMPAALRTTSHWERRSIQVASCECFLLSAQCRVAVSSPRMSFNVC
jgi:hypothetical protein